MSLNGYIDEKPLFDKNQLVRDFSLLGALKVRRDIVANYFNGTKIDLRTTVSVDRLALRVKYLEEDEEEFTDAPAISIKLSGELKKSLIYEALFVQGSFIENMGIEVPATIGNLPPFRRESIEYYFCIALANFWPTFELTLKNNAVSLMTFNRAFLLFGEKHLHTSLARSKSALPSFTHLLVDEFQDISPQIASWLRATQRRVQDRSIAPSLMAIGDDWQSIYGWRGSAPELFIGFPKHFKCSEALGGPNLCEMMENFRSIDEILVDGAVILSSVAVKMKKESIAQRKTEQTDHGVNLVTGYKPTDELNLILAEIETQLEFVNSLPQSDKKKVIVLSRTADMRDELKELVKRRRLKGVHCYTFHGAKGLQGEVAILCENSSYDMQHILRNAVYAATGLFEQTYDQAAKDEALRLAYVAVTRGIRRVVWFVEQPEGAASLLQ